VELTEVKGVANHKRFYGAQKSGNKPELAAGSSCPAMTHLSHASKRDPTPATSRLKKTAILTDANYFDLAQI
jgi:hypothetical protein